MPVKKWSIPRKAYPPGIAILPGVILFLSISLIHSSHSSIFPAPDSTRVFRIGVLYWSMQIPCQKAMRAGVEGEAERINARVKESGQGKSASLQTFVAGDGQRGIERQIMQMENLIQAHPDLILVQPTDNAALAASLKKANAMGIPVVAYDQYIMGGNLTSYITTDNYQAGWLDGEYSAHLFQKKGEVKLILVEYPHVSSTVERENGFLDALHAFRIPFRILGTYSAVEPGEGKRVGKKILKDFPEPGSVDLLFTVNDGGGLAVVEELAAAGRYEIAVATVDGDPRSVRNIIRGRLTRIDAAQFCGPMGGEAMRVSYDYLNGKRIPRIILIPPFPVTRETAGIYPGWMGPIPKRFKKPWSKTGDFWTGTLKITYDQDRKNGDGLPR